MGNDPTKRGLAEVPKLQTLPRKGPSSSTRGLPPHVKRHILARVVCDEGAEIGQLVREFGVGSNAILGTVVEGLLAHARDERNKGIRIGRLSVGPPDGPAALRKAA